MTVIYTPYTSLEDAWGSDFNKPDKKKKTKKSGKSDPLCDLYSKRYKKIRKPFYAKDSDMLENDYFNKVHSFNGAKDLNMYYGYKDDDFSRLVNEERQQTNNMIIDEEGQCINTHPKKAKKKKVRFMIEPEDEDDVYLQQAITNEDESHNFEDVIDTSQQQSFDHIYSNVYEETDDEIIEEESISSSKEPIGKTLSKLIEEEINNNSYVKSLHRKNDSIPFVDERQYLDLLMYIFSGIILIFMMEQFIQIGIRMKTPSY